VSDAPTIDPAADLRDTDAPISARAYSALANYAYGMGQRGSPLVTVGWFLSLDPDYYEAIKNVGFVVGSELRATRAWLLGEPPEPVESGPGARLTALEREVAGLRRLLWLRHGCPMGALYGDDGEMQCSACGLDFRFDPVDRIEARFIAQGAAAVREVARG
jgi:hypothetical protein